jgi:hypothetical protein
MYGGTLEAEATFRGQLIIVRMERKTNNLGWMLYSVYAVLGEYFTQCQHIIMAYRDREG